MPKHKDQKIQKSLFSYFSVNKTQSKPTEKEKLQKISDSLEDLFLEKEENNVKKVTILIENLSQPESTTNVEKDAPNEDSECINETATETANVAKDDHMTEAEDEEELVHKPFKKKKRHLIYDDEEEEEEEENKPLKRKTSDNDANDYSEEEEELPVTRPKKKNKHILINDDDDEAEDDDKKDFREDLEFLDRTDILQERTRGKQVSRYTEALQKLKDKKSKLAEYDKVDKGPIESYTIALDSSEDEEDFVVDDDIIDGEKANVEKAELPAEFSKGRTLSFKRQLETYILYLIELVLNPVFDISSESKYRIAKEAVMKRIQGYRDSIVTSDVWLPSFKEAVDKYPNWHIRRPHIADDFIYCEACRSNKPATMQVKLSSDTDLTSETLFLGSECFRKGKLYHESKHFSEHMYHKVKELVENARKKMRRFGGEQQGVRIFNRLERSGDIKKLTKDVNALFNDIVMVYNLKGQRARVALDSSSEDDESD